MFVLYLNMENQLLIKPARNVSKYLFYFINTSKGDCRNVVWEITHTTNARSGFNALYLTKTALKN